MILALYPLIVAWGIVGLVVGFGIVLVTERMTEGTTLRRLIRLLGWLIFVVGFVVALLGFFAYEPDVDHGLGRLSTGE